MHKGEDLDCKVLSVMMTHLNILKYKIMLRQYDLLEHVKQYNNQIIICHYSVCAFTDN